MSMREPFVFLIIILAFASFAYLSINQMRALHDSSVSKSDTVLVNPKITSNFSYHIRYTSLNKSVDSKERYLMDSLVIERDSISSNQRATSGSESFDSIDKVIYNLYVFSSEDKNQKFQTYTATKETNFRAKVKSEIRTIGSSYSWDNFVITAFIYLKNGDIMVLTPKNY
jgi:hypothetical protein